MLEPDEATGVNHGYLGTAGVMLRLMIDAHQRGLTPWDAVKDNIHGRGDVWVCSALLRTPAVTWLINDCTVALGAGQAAKQQE